MIIGVGMDMVELSRIGRAGTERIAARILAETEAEALPRQARRRLEWTAGRFAAKEAVAKAAGCGIGGTLSFRDIRIENGAEGRPQVRLSETGSAALGYGGGGVKIHLSITHTRDTAAAFAVIERE